MHILHILHIFTAHKRSLGQGNILHLSVILFTGGEYLGRYPPSDQAPPRTRYTPPQYTPLGPGTSPDQVHPLGPGTSPRTRYTPGPGTPPGPGIPPEQCMLGDTGNKRAVRILLECILVFSSSEHFTHLSTELLR